MMYNRLKITCQCGEEYSISVTEYRGHQVQCPSCQTPLPLGPLRKLMELAKILNKNKGDFDHQLKLFNRLESVKSASPA